MFTYDLYSYQYFCGCLNFIEVKKKQREFVKKHHPDNSGSTDADAKIMALINAEYNYIVSRHNNGQQSFPIGGRGTVPPREATFENDGFNWRDASTTTGWYKDPLTGKMHWGPIPPGFKEEVNYDASKPFDDDPIDPPGWEKAEDRKTKTKHGFYTHQRTRTDDAEQKRSAAEEYVYQQQQKETENLKNYLDGLENIIWRPLKSELIENRKSGVMPARKLYMERLMIICRKFQLNPSYAFVMYLSEMAKDNHLILRKDVVWFAENFILTHEQRQWVVSTCENFDINS